MVYRYELHYPESKTEKISITNPLAIGDKINLSGRWLVADVEHKLTPQHFDPSITHNVVTIVYLEMVE